MSQPVQADMQALAEVRVLIVDDHDLFRSGLRNLLEDEGVLVVGEAAAGQEALNIVREVAPDVVVMDLNMPGMGGVEATRHISTEHPAGDREHDPSRALGARDRGAEADRQRQGQCDDRRRAPHQPEDSQESHLEHPHEAADRQPHPGGCLRGQKRDRLVRRLTRRLPDLVRAAAQRGEEPTKVAEVAVGHRKPPSELGELGMLHRRAARPAESGSRRES